MRVVSTGVRFSLRNTLLCRTRRTRDGKFRGEATPSKVNDVVVVSGDDRPRHASMVEEKEGTI